MESIQRDDLFQISSIKDADVILGVESIKSRYVVEAIQLDSAEGVSLQGMLSDDGTQSPVPGLQCLSSLRNSTVSPYLNESHKGTSLVTDQCSAEQLSNSSKTSEGRLQKLPIVLEYASLFAHLATFGIIGVLIRYGLEELFGPMVVGMTQNTSALFSSLPPNMDQMAPYCEQAQVIASDFEKVGCFFMGWVGIVWKKEITQFSEHLALGLSTGLMGSITTFASWNQELLNAITAGYWVRGLCGFLIGMELAQMSLQVGTDTAKGLQSAINSIQSSRVEKGLARIPKPAAESLERRQLSLFLFLVSSAVLWVLTSILVAKDAHSFNRRKLWLACVLAPPGVWTRWFLSHYNGQGIGRTQWLKWFPIGTFATNIIASNIECLLSLTNLKVHNYSSALTVGALQLGLLGCMSTVSTLVTEVCFLHQGEKWWRAYMYTILTMFSALSTGIVLYSICVWVDRYKVL